MVDPAVILQAVGVSQVADQPNLPKSYDLRPTILKRTEQDFIGSVLDELRSGKGIQALTGVIDSHQSGDTLTFLQPVHRTFYLVILEIACDPFNQPYLQPRLDPRKIESAGLVVRRVAANGKLEGWRKQGHSVRGWIPFDTENAEKLDPDPDRRPPIASGLPDLDRLLAPHAPLSESVAPLYVAPPDVCQAVGRTILYGVIPVTSSEFSEAPPVTPTPEDADTLNQLNAAIKDMLPIYLRSGGDRREPQGGRVLTADLADDLSLRGFLATLHQLRFQFRLFDADLASVALFNAFNQAIVAPDTPNAQPLGDLLSLASRILIDREAGLEVTLPQNWPTLSDSQNQTLLDLSRAALMSHLSALTAGESRFEALESRYQVRAFVRLKSIDACVHSPLWSDYSAEFTIAPWYESGSQPPVKVVLPDILNPKALASLKPSVAFSVPPKLFNFLNKNDIAKSVLSGDVKDGDDGGIAWICSFNIPIITLCAYLVLNIFLQLFNIIFWWILIVKICLPVPKKLFPKPK